MRIRNRKWWFASIIVVFILCMSVSMLLDIHNARRIVQDNYENDRRVVAALVCNAIENTFLRPITVTETMSKDSSIKELLNQPDREAAEEVEEEASEYLESLRDGFGYSMVFAVSEISKAYYTCNGISKFIDPEKDEHDIWYRWFLESGKQYDLDVDTDEAANWSLSVFVNAGVYDDRNKLLGVCGVGVDMTQLQNLLERYERIYDVKINLIDETGLIQVDTDTARIERDFIEMENLKELSDGEVYYQVLDIGSRIITYVDTLNWYLVIQNQQEASWDMWKILLPNIVCMVVGILLLVIIIGHGDKWHFSDL